MKRKGKPDRFTGQISPLFCIVDLMPGLSLEEKGQKFDELCCLLNGFFETNNFPVSVWWDFENQPEATYVRFFYGSVLP